MKSEEEIIKVIKEAVQSSSDFAKTWQTSDLDRIVPEANLELDLELDSLDRITLIILIEKKFNLPKDFLYYHFYEGTISTIGDVIKVIQIYCH